MTIRNLAQIAFLLVVAAAGIACGIGFSVWAINRLTIRVVVERIDSINLMPRR